MTESGSPQSLRVHEEEEHAMIALESLPLERCVAEKVLGKAMASRDLHDTLHTPLSAGEVLNAFHQLTLSGNMLEDSGLHNPSDNPLVIRTANEACEEFHQEDAASQASDTALRWTHGSSSGAREALASCVRTVCTELRSKAGSKSGTLASAVAHDGPSEISAMSAWF
jgi:hypothetical protein